MLVSFMICGLESRPWRQMVETLHQQLDSVDHECEVLTSIDSGEESSGTKRQRLLGHSTGEYVAFVDDDDTLSDDYCKLICEAAAQSPDVVCFSMSLNTERKMRWKTKRHIRREQWKLGLWPDNRKKGVMAANHLCAWKKSIAERVAWCPRLGYGDDQLWYGPLHATGLARTSIVISKVLYEYQFSPKNTRNQTKARIDSSKRYFGKGLRCFQIDDEIYVEDGTQSNDVVLCRNKRNRVCEVNSKINTPFHTVVLR